MQFASDIRSLPPMDENTLLYNPADWDQSVAMALAHHLGINRLNEEHWAVIFALRSYYREFGVAPPMVSISHAMGKDKNWVHELFANSLNAWMISGLPNPGEEAKSYLSNS